MYLHSIIRGAHRKTGRGGGKETKLLQRLRGRQELLKGGGKGCGSGILKQEGKRKERERERELGEGNR